MRLRLSLCGCPCNVALVVVFHHVEPLSSPSSVVCIVITCDPLPMQLSAIVSSLDAAPGWFKTWTLPNDIQCRLFLELASLYTTLGQT